MWSIIAACVSVFIATYYGSHLVSGPAPTPPDCNLNIQSFDLHEIPIYWQVQEGRCTHDDVNYENVRANVEEISKETESEWPDVRCSYGHSNNEGFVVKYGVDYYEVEEFDCIEPSRELQREKEQNTTISDYIKEKMGNSAKIDVSSYLLKLIN